MVSLLSRCGIIALMWHGAGIVHTHAPAVSGLGWVRLINRFVDSLMEREGVCGISRLP